MIRKLIQFAIFLFFANALYQTAPIGLHHFQFKDAVQELALFSQKSSDQELVDRVMMLAEEHHIPLDRDYVTVQRATGQLIITAAYLETMTFFPGFPYEREFDVEVKAYIVKEPPRP
jgi:hypothetical protein